MSGPEQGEAGMGIHGEGGLGSKGMRRPFRRVGTFAIEVRARMEGVHMRKGVGVMVMED